MIPRDVVTPLIGAVTTVTFANQETGYRVLKVEVGGKLVTVVGITPDVRPGMTVRVTGQWEDDPRFGRRVRADGVAVVTPRTLEGLHAFLASGLVRGIGPALAQRITDTFGDRAWEVLDSGSNELAMVRGISAPLAARVAEAWVTHRVEAGLFSQLAGFGLSPALARRIVRQYGAHAAHVIEREPYRLSTEVRGVGFSTADKIAQAGGIPRDAPERVDAAVVHVLSELAGEGHTVTEEREVLARAAELLALPDEALDGSVERVVGARFVVRDHEGRLAPRALSEAEESVAVRVSALARTQGEPIERPSEILSKSEGELGMKLADEQRAAVVLAASRKVSVVTGGPGVGKTTVVRAMVQLFDAARLRVALAAPTGRAAKRLAEATGREAKTIHRLLEIEPKTGDFKRRLGAPCDADVFIVDEASMIDVGLARALLEAIPDEARLVVVGDVDQLPSVGPGAVLEDLIGAGVVPVTRLQRIFRQGEGSLITLAAHAVREGRMPESGARPDDDFFVLERRTPEAALATVKKLVAERIPAKLGVDPLDDVQVLTPVKKRALGVEELNRELSALQNPGALRNHRGFGRGDKVIQTRNDYELDVYNGDLGRVVALPDPEVDGAGLAVEVDGQKKSYTGEASLSLELAYAITIHKSQGSEYPAVVIPWMRAHAHMLTRNLLYTAITRGKRMVVVVAEPGALAMALAERRRGERRTTLRERLRRLVVG